VDGLVTNASLISGPGGGGAAAHTVVLTGVAALVAGAEFRRAMTSGVLLSGQRAA
jgi:hypothetical protein